MLAQQCGTCKREEPLDEEARHEHRLEQALQQGIAEHASDRGQRLTPSSAVARVPVSRARNVDAIGTGRDEAHDRAHEARRVDCASVRAPETGDRARANPPDAGDRIP